MCPAPAAFNAGRATAWHVPGCAGPNPCRQTDGLFDQGKNEPAPHYDPALLSPTKQGMARTKEDKRPCRRKRRWHGVREGRWGRAQPTRRLQQQRLRCCWCHKLPPPHDHGKRRWRLPPLPSLAPPPDKCRARISTPSPAPPPPLPGGLSARLLAQLLCPEGLLRSTSGARCWGRFPSTPPWWK